MGRIRTIKPEFPHSESMGRCSRDARLLFVLIWTLVDDSGRTRAASRMLASLLFPYDDDAPRLIDGWLGELTDSGSIVLYEVDGAHYLQVCNWSSHQKIDKPTASKLPPFVEPSRGFASPREDSSLDQGPRTKDQGPVLRASEDAGEPQPEEGPGYAHGHQNGSAGGPRMRQKHDDATETPGTQNNATEAKPGPLQDQPASKPKRKTDPVVDRPDDVPEQTWADWLSHRRRKSATVTQTAIDGIRREASSAGITFAQALEHSIAQGWQGFRADWMQQRSGGRGGGNQTQHRKFNETPFDLPEWNESMMIVDKPKKKAAP